jgi:hypothetical protein
MWKPPPHLYKFHGDWSLVDGHLRGLCERLGVFIFLPSGMARFNELFVFSFVSQMRLPEGQFDQTRIVAGGGVLDCSEET